MATIPVGNIDDLTGGLCWFLRARPHRRRYGGDSKSRNYGRVEAGQAWVRDVSHHPGPRSATGRSPSTGLKEPILLDAQLELERRYQQCEDWREEIVLAHLATIADHTRRVIGVTSPGYRTEKTAVLREAALALERDTLIGVAGWADGDQPTEGEATLAELFGLVEQLTATAVRSATALAEGQPLEQDSVDAITEAADAHHLDPANSPPTPKEVAMTAQTVLTARKTRIV